MFGIVTGSVFFGTWLPRRTAQNGAARREVSVDQRRKYSKVGAGARIHLPLDRDVVNQSVRTRSFTYSHAFPAAESVRALRCVRPA